MLVLGHCEDPWAFTVGEVREELEDLLELQRGDLDEAKDLVTRLTQEVLVEFADSGCWQSDSDGSDETEYG